VAAMILTTVFVLFLAVTFVAWKRYLWVAEKVLPEQADTCPYSLTDVFGDLSLLDTDPSEDSTDWHFRLELPKRLAVASEVRFHQSARPCSGSSSCSSLSWSGLSEQSFGRGRISL